MIQITTWIDPNDKIWCNRAKRYISNTRWLREESLRIQNKKNCGVVIKSDSSGLQAIFREKLR